MYLVGLHKFLQDDTRSVKCQLVKSSLQFQYERHDQKFAGTEPCNSDGQSVWWHTGLSSQPVLVSIQKVSFMVNTPASYYARTLTRQPFTQWVSSAVLKRTA